MAPRSSKACRWRAVGVVTSRKPGSAGSAGAMVFRQMVPRSDSRVAGRPARGPTGARGRPGRRSRGTRRGEGKFSIWLREGRALRHFQCSSRQTRCSSFASTQGVFDAAVLHLVLSVLPDGRACLHAAAAALRARGRAVVFDKFAPRGVSGPPSGW